MKSFKLALLLLAPFAIAGSVTEKAYAATCDSISCTGTIDRVSVFKGGHSMGATVRLDSNVAPSGCGLSGGSEWLVGPTDEAVIRTLVAAQVAGRRVTLRRVDGASTCTIDYVTVL